jgi:hypothetical protein
MKPDEFERAARSLPGLMHCSLTQARRAAKATWKHYGSWHETDWYGWLGLLKPQVERLMRPRLSIVKGGADCA